MRRKRVWLAVMAATVTVASGGAMAQDLRRCDQLAAYYDRYGGKVSEGKTAVGRLERELGYEKCRRGDVAGGVQLLEEAIRKIRHNVPAA